MGGPAIAAASVRRPRPSGRLAVTFPRTVGQVPIYYAHLNTGRPRSQDELGIPTGNPVGSEGITLRSTSTSISRPSTRSASVCLTPRSITRRRAFRPPPCRAAAPLPSPPKSPTPARARRTKSPSYTSRPGPACPPRPRAEGLPAHSPKAGEKQTVLFPLTTDELKFTNSQNQLIVEPGNFHVWVVPNSAAGVQGEFTVTQ